MTIAQTFENVQSIASNAEKSGREASRLSLLEQVAERSVARCKNPKAPILFGYHRTDKKALVHRASCKQWDCPACGARNARRAIALCINHINAVGGQWYFVTITAHEKWRGKELSLQNLRRNWHKLRKRMRDQNGGHFDYFRVYEFHKDGSWHMHLITNCELPFTSRVAPDGRIKHRSNWLKENARSSGLGFMTDYQPLDNAGFAAHYVAKYMTKSTENAENWLKGMRRYQTSQGWAKLPDLHEETDFDWQYIESGAHIWFEYQNAKDAGFEVYFTKTGQKATSKQTVQYFYTTKQLPIPHTMAPIWKAKSIACQRE